MNWDRALGCICALLCIASVLHWVTHIRLTPDSTNYLTAGLNVVRHGALFVYANWPSQSMAVEVEPYVSYPPGFALYSAIFVLLLQNPTLAMVVAQGVALGFFYLALHSVARQLRFSFFVSVLLFVVVTFWVVLKWVYSHYWSEPLFLALMLGSLTQAIRLLQHPRQVKPSWLDWVFLSLSSFTKFIGVFNVGFYTVWLWQTRVRVKVVVGLVLAAILPVAGWFLRNLFLAGVITQQPVLPALAGEKWFRPIVVGYEVAGAQPFWSILTVVILVLSVYVPLQAEGFRKSTFVQVHLQLLVGLVGYFFGIFGLSLVVEIDPLDGRLLAPCLVLGVLLLLHGYQYMGKYLRGTFGRGLYFGGPLLYLALSPGFSFALPETFRLNRPVEEQVWLEIKAMPTLGGASHFYSDQMFNHQVYAGIPQRVIWDKRPEEFAGKVRQLLNVGKTPFLILAQDKPFDLYFQKHYRELGLYQETRFHRFGYSLYALKGNQEK